MASELMMFVVTSKPSGQFGQSLNGHQSSHSDVSIDHDLCIEMLRSHSSQTPPSDVMPYRAITRGNSIVFDGQVEVSSVCLMPECQSQHLTVDYQLLVQLSAVHCVVISLTGTLKRRWTTLVLPQLARFSSSLNANLLLRLMVNCTIRSADLLPLLTLCLCLPLLTHTNIHTHIHVGLVVSTS